MSTRIRLQRKGRKGYPFYHIVIADQRAPRDGKFIEKIGTYNPNVNPIALEVNMERALYWLGVGAEPSDTARNLLSEKGVMFKKHLLGGVAKGAFSEEEAEKRFNTWFATKDKEAAAIITKNEEKSKAEAKARHEAEVAVNKTKAKEIEKKTAVPIVEAVQADAEVKVEVSETPEVEVKVEVAETPEVEVKVEVAETPKVEVKEEITETPDTEVKEEAPVAEKKAE